jgi:BirA family biotin operon repressor/biotin-[acetyl-CoA-carboxylase] ligase
LSPPDPFPSRHSQPLPPELAAPLARASNRLASLVRHVQWHGVLPSTNDRAAEYAERGAPEGTVLIAGSQTAGRGRQGRSWQSPPGAGLYFSILLRPAPDVVPLLTIAAGVAVAEGIRTATGLVPTLKWPNDLLVAGRKLAGILAEAGASRTGVSHVVLGVGINVRPAVYPPDVAMRATSLEGEVGRHVDPGVVLAECLAALAARYDDLNRGRATAVLDAWRASAKPLLGQPVEWDDCGNMRRGVAEDVDGTGALVVRTAAGHARVISGEVRWM